MSGVSGPLVRIIRDQRVTFLTVGAANTAIGMGWFAVFLWLLRDAIGYLGVLLCTHIVAMLCAFVLNRRFVFHVTGHVLRDLARFELVNLSVLGFNFAMLPLLVEVFGLQVLLSQLVVVTVTVVYRWFAHRCFTFRRSLPEVV
ncbi:GtrA family protein [Mycobacterium haemophilum]|uniref:GtrA/DPMS transmembrane domain-containing protein n=1 Tax=Mycobacterium haemophilum TaxID=29311 RepID=A0A0I9Z8G9_9MYCO|nr:GtrA family protein [Mycobacterium haemophilum]AKN17564.1 hypothetical protein B586_14850 [Mycobacterium haemophilum DSM 44634]KLO29467.1 hypothetical protein ABH39_11750 [Mycobacterium haemophilum]KLO35919.1 hypothetical protein ABH38_13590 [Mycobacterium haemophilum]KLO41477.1 hypothetical protein ABH37_12890 [Mycobacterium haemophilum]KLO49357.1 hypothetical protein ABH36_12150 [Mycobacterium haemophilum]